MGKDSWMAVRCDIISSTVTQLKPTTCAHDLSNKMLPKLNYVPMKVHNDQAILIEYQGMIKTQSNNHKKNFQLCGLFTSPWLAPLTRPAISTNSTLVGTIFCDLLRLERTSNRGSGTATTPTFGSIVQKGKFAACALPFSTCLKQFQPSKDIYTLLHNVVE